MKKILITGGAGFIGSNFVPYFIEKYQNYHIIVLDKLTYAGNKENLALVMSHPRFEFIKGDICDEVFINELFRQNKFHGVIHFAAESHVDNSISDPSIFAKTNVIGTCNLLNSANIQWMVKPHEAKEEFKDARFHHISTDEVYGSLGETGFFTETTPYAPNSPYSASKASSDMFVRSYFHTYGLNVVTTNCSNNYGPMQHDEKLIPTVINKALCEEPIPIYGNGKNVRDWLYVLDHCTGIDVVFHKGISGETYNVGGDNEMTNIDLVNIILKKLDAKLPRKKGASYVELISFVDDRAGHDLRYAIDSGKIQNSLKWYQIENFESGINKTIDYYLHKYQKTKNNY
jgi:dTDP-glucose 4,6-dehydratase